jgi:hypothetical protein
MDEDEGRRRKKNQENPNFPQSISRRDAEARRSVKTFNIQRPTLNIQRPGKKERTAAMGLSPIVRAFQGSAMNVERWTLDVERLPSRFRATAFLLLPF